MTDLTGATTDEATRPHDARALIDALLAGDVDAVRAQFDGPADIDDPLAGRQVDGGFEELVREWAPAHLATVVSTDVRNVTRGADGRFCATEVHFELDLGGKPQQLDVVVVAEFNRRGGMIATRLYYRAARLTGTQNQRPRILPETPQYVEPFSPIIEEYQRTLGAGDPKAMAATFTEDATFDGHGESQDLRDGRGMGFYAGREAIEALLEQMFSIGDEEALYEGDTHTGTKLEKLNNFSDGRTTVVEFNIIHVNHPVNRVSAGVAAYEVGEDGLLVSARIYDEAW